MAACSFRNGAEETNQEETCHEKSLRCIFYFIFFHEGVADATLTSQVSFAGLRE